MTPKAVRNGHFIFWQNVEAWQPDPGARPRWENKDSIQGSQSTRNGNGLAIAGWLALLDERRYVPDGAQIGRMWNPMIYAQAIGNPIHANDGGEGKPSLKYSVGKCLCVGVGLTVAPHAWKVFFSDSRDLQPDLLIAVTQVDVTTILLRPITLGGLPPKSVLYFERSLYRFSVHFLG